MYQLTRKQLTELYKRDNCKEWKTRIEKYLNESSFENDSFKLTIREDDLSYVKRYGTILHKQLLKRMNIIFDGINNMEDVYRITGKSQKEIIPWPNTQDKAKEAQNGLAELQIITEAYNKNKEVLDWNNTRQWKWFNYFIKKGGSWVFHISHSYSYNCYGGFGLYFLCKADAEEAAVKFKNIYDKFLGI